MKKMLTFPSPHQATADFESLVGPHLDHLYRVAFRFCTNRSDAEDLVQDLLVKLYPRQAELARIEKLRPWLVTTLYRMFIDDTRRRARSRLQPIDDETAFYDSVPSATPGPADSLAREQRLQSMQAAFDRLSDDHRTLLALHDIEGYRLNELHAMLGIPLGTLKSRIHRARARLRELLAEG